MGKRRKKAAQAGIGYSWIIRARSRNHAGPCRFDGPLQPAAPTRPF